MLVDQSRCRGYRKCMEGCPYKKTMYNTETRVTEKCIGCYPRIEGKEPMTGGVPTETRCMAACVGQIRLQGLVPIDRAKGQWKVEPKNPLYYLIHVAKVALPLYPQFGTEPNVYYIPPRWVPRTYLRQMFGPGVDAAIEAYQAENCWRPPTFGRTAASSSIQDQGSPKVKTWGGKTHDYNDTVMPGRNRLFRAPSRNHAFVRKTGRTPYKGPAMATDTRSNVMWKTTAVIYRPIRRFEPNPELLRSDFRKRMRILMKGFCLRRPRRTGLVRASSTARRMNAVREVGCVLSDHLADSRILSGVGVGLAAGDPGRPPPVELVAALPVFEPPPRKRKQRSPPGSKEILAGISRVGCPRRAARAKVGRPPRHRQGAGVVHRLMPFVGGSGRARPVVRQGPWKPVPVV